MDNLMVTVMVMVMLMKCWFGSENGFGSLAMVIGVAVV